MENIFAVLKYDAYHNLQKLREPVDKNKWSTEPAVVNAFYNPNRNDIGELYVVVTMIIRYGCIRFSIDIVQVFLILFIYRRCILVYRYSTNRDDSNCNFTSAVIIILIFQYFLRVFYNRFFTLSIFPNL